MGTVENRLLHLGALLEMVIDVLDRHRGIVDQDADRQREASEGHDVDGFAERRQAGDRGENRQRYGDRDDQGAAPAAQEQQDQQARQAGGDDAFPDDAADRGAHEHRLIAQGHELQTLRHGGAREREASS